MHKIKPGVVPSSLDLLPMPFAFSQRPLLDVNGFIQEAKKRGFNVNRDLLMYLHKIRVLIPLFRIYARKVEPGVDLYPPKQYSMYRSILYEASLHGQLRDPLQTRFRPWPKSYSRHTLTLHIGVRYSWFQLLALRGISSVIERLHRNVQILDDRMVYDHPRLRPSYVDMTRKMRALSIVLEVLAPRYTPRVLGRISCIGSVEQIRDYVLSSPNVERQLLSSIKPTTLREQAEFWLANARSFDPLGDWHRVVKAATPRRWEDLRYDALNAMELRIAAEMILQYYEDLAADGYAEPLQEYSAQGFPLLPDRLKVDYVERAKTLRDYRLENTPTVVVAVEGDTEMMIVPRVLKLVAPGSSSRLVKFVNLKSVSGDPKLVARSIAIPEVHPDHGDAFLLLRPLTAFVVVVDPESRYSTPQKVEKQHKQVVDSIIESLPDEFRTRVRRSDIEHLVVIRTWGDGGCFEFANFTDEELALGIQRVAKRKPDHISNCIPEIEAIEKQLAKARKQKKDIKTVWRRWDCEFSKIELAEETWPMLKKKLSAENLKQMPVAQVADQIIDFVYEIHPVTHLETASGET
ncbi:MAG: hypothetical protein OXI96_06385 [Acidimicrobiaceae bacterium]|nr:hypothetical protein [Acidimicrobiaceae bacterium]